MLLERSSFLIHREKTITEIYRENTTDEMIDSLIEKLQGLKKEDPEKRRKIYIDGTLFLISHILEEKGI